MNFLREINNYTRDQKSFRLTFTSAAPTRREGSSAKGGKDGSAILLIRSAVTLDSEGKCATA